MVGTKRFLTDHQRSLQERFGVGVATLGLVEPGQVVERRCNSRVISTERRCPKADRKPSTRLAPLAKSLAHQFAQCFWQPVPDFYVSPQGRTPRPNCRPFLYGLGFREIIRRCIGVNGDPARPSRRRVHRFDVHLSRKLKLKLTRSVSQRFGPTP